MNEIEFVKHQVFRETPDVIFYDISVKDNNATDLVEHTGPAVSPPDEYDGIKQFYIHYHQVDHNRVISGDRTFEFEGVDRNLIRLWPLIRCIKLAALYQCRHDYSLEVYFQGDEAEHEGYVFDNGFGTYKLVDRMTFSRRNFLHSRMARG